MVILETLVLKIKQLPMYTVQWPVNYLDKSETSFGKSQILFSCISLQQSSTNVVFLQACFVQGMRSFIMYDFWFQCQHLNFQTIVWEGAAGNAAMAKKTYDLLFKVKTILENAPCFSSARRLTVWSFQLVLIGDSGVGKTCILFR